MWPFTPMARTRPQCIGKRIPRRRLIGPKWMFSWAVFTMSSSLWSGLPSLTRARVRSRSMMWRLRGARCLRSLAARVKGSRFLVGGAIVSVMSSSVILWMTVGISLTRRCRNVPHMTSKCSF